MDLLMLYGGLQTVSFIRFMVNHYRNTAVTSLAVTRIHYCHLIPLFICMFEFSSSGYWLSCRNIYLFNLSHPCFHSHMSTTGKSVSTTDSAFECCLIKKRKRKVTCFTFQHHWALKAWYVSSSPLSAIKGLIAGVGNNSAGDLT